MISIKVDMFYVFVYSFIFASYCIVIFCCYSSHIFLIITKHWRFFFFILLFSSFFLCCKGKKELIFILTSIRKCIHLFEHFICNFLFTLAPSHVSFVRVLCYDLFLPSSSSIFLFQLANAHQLGNFLVEKRLTFIACPAHVHHKQRKEMK